MFAGLGQDERYVCVFPSWLYPNDDPCSAKRNVENALIVDVTTQQRQWWEVEEKRAQKKAAELQWADMLVPLKIGGVVIVGAIALGIYFNIAKTRKPVRRQAFA